MSDYETQDFPENAAALAAIREQHKRGEPLVWTGIDHLHHSISATSPEPSWYFSAEGLEYMAERDHTFEDVMTMVTFQLGYHHGVMSAEKEIAQLQRLLRGFLDEDKDS